VARDRKRAKQRQQRRRVGGDSAGSTPLVREDVPGALDHASGDVDEFDAALVRGAEGVQSAPESLPDELEDPAVIADGNGSGTGLVAPGRGGDGGGSGGSGGSGGGGSAGGGPSLPAPTPGARPAIGGRAVAFLRASWAELQRVQWPDRRQVTQATAVVLGFVAIAGAYLGLADYVAKTIVEAIL
jgi:preprotein translocase subunit SecE